MCNLIIKAIIFIEIILYKNKRDIITFIKCLN